MTIIGTNKYDLDTPVLCLDAEMVDANISKMARFVRQRGVNLRPHTKTHKCPQIAHRQIAAGAVGVCCAKLGEAEVMAQAGVKGILVPNQIVGPNKIGRLAGLSAWADVTVAADNEDNVREMSAAAVESGITIKIIIELDVGMGRCGVRSMEEGVQLAKTIVGLPGTVFCGIMGYEGHCVMKEPYEEREKTTATSLKDLISLKNEIEAAGIEVPIVSSGGTGTFQITPDIEGITEIQAGSYVTMDAKYRSVGIDQFENALTILSTVISVHGESAVCDLGLKSATGEFGMPVVIDPPGWEIVGLSEEHAALKRSPMERSGENVTRDCRVGDVIEVIPSHGCTTINLHDFFYITKDDSVVGVWPIAARGKFR